MRKPKNIKYFKSKIKNLMLFTAFMCFILIVFFLIIFNPNLVSALSERIIYLFALLLSFIVILCIIITNYAELVDEIKFIKFYTNYSIIDFIIQKERKEYYNTLYPDNEYNIDE